LFIKPPRKPLSPQPHSLKIKRNSDAAPPTAFSGCLKRDRPMTDILAKILATKAEEIAAQKAEISLENMKVQARTAEPPRDFIAAIRAKLAEDSRIEKAEYVSKQQGMAELQRILGEVGNGVDAAVQKYQSMEQHVAQSWM